MSKSVLEAFNLGFAVEVEILDFAILAFCIGISISVTLMSSPLSLFVIYSAFGKKTRKKFM